MTVTVKVFHNDTEKSSTDYEGLATVGIYGSSGSAQYEVQDRDVVLTVRFTGQFDPETGNEADVKAKATPKTKE